MKRFFEVELSENIPLEREFLDLQAKSEDIKCILLLGYSVYKTGATELFRETNDRIIKEKSIEIESACKYQYESSLEALRKENSLLIQQMHTQIDKARTDVEQRYMAEISGLEYKLSHMKHAKEELQLQIADLHRQIHDEGVQQLKDMLREKETELRVLRSTNAVKGVLGENLIIQTLRSQYHDAEVDDMSHISHVCDVHMKLPGGNGTFVFESKYKQAIDKKDLQKFYHDMEGLKDSVKGGVFVSILSKNIPGKGSMCVEQLPNSNTLLLFLGFHDETDFHTYFLPHVKMFMVLCQHHQSEASDVDVHKILEEINFYYQMLTKTRGRLDDMKNKFVKLVQDVDQDHGVILQRMERLLQAHDYQPNEATVASMDVRETKRGRVTHLCDTCGQVFTSKRGLTMHLKTHA